MLGMKPNPGLELTTLKSRLACSTQLSHPGDPIPMYIFNRTVPLPLTCYPVEIIMARPKDLATKIFITALARIVMFSLITGWRAIKL